MMAPSMRKMEFSLAHIRAVAATAGYQVTIPEVDVDSVDGTLMSDEGRRPRLDFQAKATSQDVLKGSNIHFALPKKNYDDLRGDSIVPRILIVVLVPEDEGEWIFQTHEQICLRHCAYWLSLEGRPSSANKSSVTVRIPTANVFTTDIIQDLMRKAGEGVPL